MKPIRKKPIRKLVADRAQALKTAKPKQREMFRQKYREALMVAILRKEARAA